MSIERDSTIAVIGAGAMGSGIAQVAAQAGHRVIILDANDGALQRSQSNIIGALGKLVERGKLESADRDDMVQRLSWSTSLADAAPAALVIEAIIENMQAKTELFGQLATIVGPGTILASNTSSLSIARLAGHVDRPERFAGLHFFNPVPVMKLVEVVPGPQTDPAIIDGLLALMKGWGKIGVRVRDVPGFIVNRVARPYYAEGFAALGEGIDAAAIDHVMESAGGFRMGPLALADMIGHDVNYTVATSVYDAYDGKTRFRPQPSQQALFESGRLGRKSGSGVYDYSAALPQPEYVKPGKTPSALETAEHHAGITAIIELARQAGLDCSINIDLPAESIRTDGFVIALGDGRTIGHRKDVDVLIDHARNFAAAPTWAISARTPEAASAAAALAQMLGKRLVLLPDRPGQIVLRTLAQLANAAADAVLEQVAAADDIDAAMRHGANHPEGPLEWAARIGHDRVANALNHISDETGEELYRPCALLKASP